jgi:hypothetical protein
VGRCDGGKTLGSAEVAQSPQGFGFVVAGSDVLNTTETPISTVDNPLNAKIWIDYGTLE